MDYKDEFNYYAVALIFGLKSPHISNFKIFSQEVMRKYKDLHFSESSSLTPDNTIDNKRRLKISDSRYFIADHCKLSSGICRVITFIDYPNKIQISDALFSEYEYEYFSNGFNETVKNKIQTLGILLRSITDGKLIDVPLLINEFKNIVLVLFKHPELWVKEL